jgi:hypothetical protein
MRSEKSSEGLIIGRRALPQNELLTSKKIHKNSYYSDVIKEIEKWLV